MTPAATTYLLAEDTLSDPPDLPESRSGLDSADASPNISVKTASTGGAALAESGVYVRRFKAFGCANSVLVHSASPDQAESALHAALLEALRIQAKYSRYVPDSALSVINREAASRTVAVDRETLGLLHMAEEAYRVSGGLFDITSGVLRRAWNFTDHHLPSEEELRPLLPLIGFEKLSVSDCGIRFGTPGMEIDFGGIGKEYAVDRVVGILRSMEISSALVNFGGDTYALGAHPSGRAWRVGVAHPRREHAISEVLSIENSSLATSGDYQRYFVVDGVRHCHLLNPHTGRSQVSFASVSICAPSCLVAGILSSTAMLKPRPEAALFLNTLGISALTIDEHGTIFRF